MRVAVLSDIHANFVALQAVSEHIRSWRADVVVMAGDLVNRGPRPAECLDFVLEMQATQGWRMVRGNHEDYVISRADPGVDERDPAFEVHRASYWTYEQLGKDVSPLQSMPFQQSIFGPDGSELRVVHASMRNNRDGIYPETSDRELSRKLIPKGNSRRPPAALVAGHTHRPLVRRLNGSLVVNAGSVGLPFDRDPRPSYAQISFENGKWRARIVRVEYDLAAAEHDFILNNYFSGGGPLVRLVHIELLEARSQLYQWSVRYQEQALRGEISMAESVELFLNRSPLER